jgi:hypothetical protein
MIDSRSSKALVACLTKIWLLLQDKASASNPHEKIFRRVAGFSIGGGKTDFGMQTDMPREMVNA